MVISNTKDCKIEFTIDVSELLKNIPKMETIYLENPTIEECLSKVNDHTYVWPIYTCKLEDIPDWSEVKHEMIIRPFRVEEGLFDVAVENFKKFMDLYCETSTESQNKYFMNRIKKIFEAEK